MKNTKEQISHRWLYLIKQGVTHINARLVILLAESFSLIAFFLHGYCGGSLLVGGKESRRDGQYPMYSISDLSIRWHPDNRYLMTRFGIVSLMPGAQVAKPLRFYRLSEDTGPSFLKEGCDWDPQSDRIVFSQQLPGSSEAEIFITPVTKFTPKKVVGSSFGLYNAVPAWEPTGKRIAFLSVKKKFPNHGRLAIIHPDGSGAKILAEGFIYSERLLWSPKGHNILLTMSNLQPGNENFRTVVINVDTGHSQQVLLSGVGSNDERLGRYAGWSPDGQTIAFCADKPDIALYGDMRRGICLWHMRDHSTSVLLPPKREAPSCEYATWSPDGKYIAFLQGEVQGQTNRLAVINVRTGQVRELYPGPKDSFIGPPCWSPDGRSLAVITGDPGLILKITLDEKPHVSPL